MCNVVSKMVVTACLAGTMFMTGCGSKEARVKDEAMTVYKEAEAAFQNRDYALAAGLLDTLSSRYPSVTSVQRDAMHLRPMVIEGQTIRELESCDSLVAALEAEKASLDSRFRMVDNPRLVEGYYVSKKQPSGDLFSRDGIEARISPDGHFYMLSSLTGRNIKHNSITLIADDGEVTSEVVDYDGERNYRSGGNEMITYNGALCDSLGEFVMAHSSLTLRFNGSSSVRIKLPEAVRDAVAETYEMSVVMTELAAARRKREFLDRQLMLARDQIARTLRDSTDN
ncbi:MAG: hypothetical protein NC117_06850 [Pseudoflavonifractor sp.]|nr:hypothetical protein [Pseudoflavonifractor sp.]